MRTLKTLFHLLPSKCLILIRDYIGLHSDVALSTLAPETISAGHPVTMEEAVPVPSNLSDESYEQEPPMVDQRGNTVHLGYISWIIITTAASIMGWGAHCDQTSVQARWSFPTKGIASNILEIQSAFLTMTALVSQIKDKSVLLRMDNRIIVSHIQHQGGIHSLSLLREVELIMLWAERNLIDLKALYLLGHLEQGGQYSELPGWQRVVPSSPNFQLDHGSIRIAGNRSLCLSNQCQVTQIHLTPPSSPGRGGGCSIEPMFVHSCLCLFSLSPYLGVYKKTNNGINISDSNSSILAKTPVVSLSGTSHHLKNGQVGGKSLIMAPIGCMP